LRRALGQAIKGPEGERVNSSPTLSDAVSRFGAAAKAKLDNPAAAGAPEDQLRAPRETLVEDIGSLIGLAAHEAVTLSCRPLPTAPPLTGHRMC